MLHPQAIFGGVPSACPTGPWSGSGEAFSLTNPLRRHALDGNCGRGWVGGVNGILVPSLHPNPCLSDKSLLGGKEGLGHSLRLSFPTASISLQDLLDLEAEKTHATLITITVLACRYPGIGEMPHLKRY